MQSRDVILTNKIKEVIHAFVHVPPKLFTTTFSIYLAKKIDYDYTYMSNIFSKTEGKSLEKYLIQEKINRVKQLILKNELSLTEIAKKQLYCNLSYLCSQFKKVTAIKLSDFRRKNNE